MCMRSEDHYKRMRGLVPLYEGFLTYGGMSVREMEAMAVGLDETMDEDMISQGPQFIEYMVNELVKRGIPVITPAGGLGCHLDAEVHRPHARRSQYIAGALGAAMYIAGGVRGMERGTLSEQRNPDGSEVFSEMELLRLAMPRRVFTLSQVKYAIDRIAWLYENRKLVGGLVFIEEPRDVALLLRAAGARLRLAGEARRQVPRRFRRQPVASGEVMAGPALGLVSRGAGRKTGMACAPAWRSGSCAWLRKRAKAVSRYQEV